jgi:hypothetical protein
MLDLPNGAVLVRESWEGVTITVFLQYCYYMVRIEAENRMNAVGSLTYSHAYRRLRSSFQRLFLISCRDITVLRRAC